MKIALIIYIASWIILLAIYVGCVIDDKSTSYSDDVQSVRKRNIGKYFTAHSHALGADSLENNLC